MKMMESEGRRLISFESHIVDDVVRKTGGKYTPSQVRDLFRASVSYINNLCRYGDVLTVSVPYIGKVVCNLLEMRRRQHNLQRLESKFGSLSAPQRQELEGLNTKIRDLEEYAGRNQIKGGDAFIRWNKPSLQYMRHGYKFEEIQKIQDNEFKHM